MIGGDFNVVLNDEEKIGGIPILAQDIKDFAFCINSCELEEIQFKGNPFTWWNGRATNDCIFERLDRMLLNAELQNWFTHLEVEHLARTCSDHAPLLCTYGEVTQNQHRPFKFLKFWVDYESFFGTVESTYGDIFKQFIIREEIVRIKENLFEESPSSGNRSLLQQSQAEHKKYLHYEEEYWRQKYGIDKFVEGDRNTKFFHNLVKGRRKRLQIQRI
ncbi:uncharacterized protein LOC132611939 [Lycium barbarum]|uniref:uncharacterized protein LOC132611939 n=1 Tax=Lycium barbarum TaxID=112863 RepID=UPI00293F6AF4|nr:uncharacterized protein LOC132611939 [Lycium barbarum]